MARWADQKISIAFAKMLRTQSIDKVTVIAICEKAGVNRQSFYYHFRDLGELYRHIVRSKLDRIIPGGNLYHSWPKQLESILKYCRKYKVWVDNIYNSSYKADFMELLREYTDDIVSKYMSQFFREGTEKLKEEERIFITKVCSMSFVGIFRMFIEKDMEDDPAKVAAWSENVFGGSFEYIAGRFIESRE